MTGKPRWPLATEDARRTLRAAGLRCTPARIAVLQCLDSFSAPMSPAAVAGELADYGFDKSTIYRSLSELEDTGVVHRLNLGDSVRRFEFRDDDSHEPDHPHFMCIDCGDIVCLADYRVELKPRRGRTSGPGVISEVLVRGHCRKCLPAT